MAALALLCASVGCGSDTPLPMPPPTPPGGSQCAAKTLAPWSRKTLGGGGAVSFNELHYQPAGDPRLEWLELYNPLAIQVDLSGFRVDGAVRYTFPAGTFLAGRGYLVLAADADLLNRSAGAKVAVGSYAGQLPDEGGTVELWNNAGRRLDLLTYGDREPWPVLPGGSGASLAKASPTTPSELAESWVPSAQPGGTPGQANVSGDRAPGVVFHEVAAGGDDFWLELHNPGDAPVALAGWLVTSSRGEKRVLGDEVVAPGGVYLLRQTALGLRVAVGDKLFLLAPTLEPVDAVRIEGVPRARSSAAIAASQRRGDLRSAVPFLYPDRATPGEANVLPAPATVVINEIMYHRPEVLGQDGVAQKDPLEWLELHNPGTSPVDLGGYQLVDGVEFVFPTGASLPAGGFLVVANDRGAMRAAYPGLSSSLILGDFKKGLANGGETLVLRDACGNEVDRVRYFDGGRWPAYADGGGASLELRDARADHTAAEAWAASQEGGAPWETVRYEGVAAPSAVGPDGVWQELVLGLLDAGEVLIDDVSVVADPAGAATELIDNGGFEAGAAGFRLLGTHRHSAVIEDPQAPGNHVLHLVATDPTEHMHNHVEVTLAKGHRITNGLTYRVSLRARWLAGSPRLNTRLYFNRLARTTVLARPSRQDTPAAPNSARVENLGPTYQDLRHSPAVPGALQPIEVSLRADDPDGVGPLQLFYGIAGAGRFTSVPMTPQPDGRHRGTIPGQAAGALLQFYVAGQDLRGATSLFPARGPESRALLKVDDGLAAQNGLHNLRILLHPDDEAFLFTPSNLMSNDHVGATLIEDERDVYYDAGVRLKSSQRGRPETLRVGFALRFSPDRLFRGSYDSVLVDRSEGVGYGQREMLIEQVMNHAGSVPSRYNDLAKVLVGRPELVGPAALQLARNGPLFLDQQMEDGSDGLLFEYELVYYPVTTTDGTPTGLKLPKPDQVVGTAIKDLGADPEGYRYSFLVKNNRWRDDYRGLMTFARGLGQSGAALDAAVAANMDADQWLRAFAFATLSGAVDNYASGAGHNANFFLRPSDGRALYLPHDLDFYGGSPQSAVVASPDLARLIASPERARRYYAHLWDIITTSYNGTYMAGWCSHLGQLLPGQDFASHLRFITARADWVMNTAPDAVLKAVPRVAFAITTGGPLMVTTPTAQLAGNAWLDIAAVRRVGAPGALALTFPGRSSWQATVPVACGAQDVALQAVDAQGQVQGTSSITVIRSGAGCP